MAEQTDVALYLLWHEADELAYGIECRIAQQPLHFCLVVDVDSELTNAIRHFVFPVSSIEQPEVLSLRCQLSGDGTADGACTTNDENLHRFLLIVYG